VNVNVDGKTDIIVAFKDSNNVGVFLNSGSGTFSATQGATYGTLANSAPMSVTTGDMNGDGKLDIIVANSGTNEFGVLLNNGDGTFPVAQVVFSAGAGSVPVSVVTGDVTGDARPDVVVANSDTNAIGVFIDVCI
ncbi:unnamed protein product, partial [Rotaria sp. Silwood2]